MKICAFGKTIKSILSVAVFAILSTASIASEAKANPTVQFINDASLKLVLQVESAKLALAKSSSPDVKTLAEQVIEGNMAATKKLADIAEKKNLKINSEAELIGTAKHAIAGQTYSSSFDRDYVQNQVIAANEAIDMFNAAAVSKDVELAGFATGILPKLKHDLHYAEQLVTESEKK